MLSQPYPIQQQQHDYQYHTQDHLSTSLPLAQPQPPSTELLTSSFHPNSLDHLGFLNGEPLNDYGMDLFSLATQNDNPAVMNLDSLYGIPTLDEFSMVSLPMSSAQPGLSSSLDAYIYQFDMPINATEQQQQQQQHQQNRLSNTSGSRDYLTTPYYKGHRRKRSSSVPPFFHSVKKQIIQQPSFIPASSDNNNNMGYLSNTMQPAPIAAGSSSSSTLTQQHYAKPLPIQIQRNPAPLHRHASPVSLDQQQLDKKLLQVDFNDITVAGLKDCLRERNLSVAGRKAELVDRLRNEQQRVCAQQQQQQPTKSLSAPAVRSHHQDRSTTTTTTPSTVNSPPSSPSTSSIASSASPHSYQTSSPTPINQLTHRLGGLGFQPTCTPSALATQPYHQLHQTHTMPMPLPQQPFGFHPDIPQEFKLSLDSIQQQWKNDSAMNHFYQP